MTQVFRIALAAGVVVAAGSVAAAQQPPNPAGQPLPTPPPAAQTPPAPAPAVAAPVAVPGAVTCPVAVPPAVAPSRAFNAPAGMLLHQVIPARAADFERLIAYVRDALAKTTNTKMREQFKGMTFWRTVEAGPNGDALYVLLVNPAVPCLDYALAPLLSEAYPDPAQLTEIWALYTSSVRAMGTTLLNMVPVPETPATPPLTPPTTTPTTTPKTAPGSSPTNPPAGVPTKPVDPSTTSKPAPSVPPGQ